MVAHALGVDRGSYNIVDYSLITALGSSFSSSTITLSFFDTGFISYITTVLVSKTLHTLTIVKDCVIRTNSVYSRCEYF